MKRVIIIVLTVIFLLIAVLFIAYPHIEFKTKDKLIRFSYSDDFSEYDDNHSYNELYAYNEKHDVSIKSFDVKKFLFFYVIEMEYIPGDFREVQFILEESYIENFIKNAKICENDKDIDIACPACPFTLRTVGRDVEVVRLLTPDDVFKELIKKRA